MDSPLVTRCFLFSLSEYCQIVYHKSTAQGAVCTLGSPRISGLIWYASPPCITPRCITLGASLIHQSSSYLISLSHIIFKNMTHVESFSNFVVVFSFSQLGSMLIVANLRSRVEVCNQGNKDPIQAKRFCSQQTHPE